MQADTSLRKSLLKVAFFATLSLFLLPILTYGFSRYVLHERDMDFMHVAQDRVYAASSATSEEKQAKLDFYTKHPLSKLCANREPQAQEFRAQACETWGDIWQFSLARQVAGWTLVGGMLVLLAIAALGRLAFLDRKLQYLSFVSGWRLMTLASAAAVVLQGAMVVWLSFWVTAFFFHHYYIKLIAIAAIAALGAVAVIVKKIFQRLPHDNGVNGELVSEQDAPVLWRRIRHMAERLKTAPPDHIVAGIDVNFFVTEAPLTVQGQELQGRTLFVSIPLLRILSIEEADAVLGHELAHFRGGDTKASAKLGPKLQQYDQYLHGMLDAGLTMVVFYFMQLYRLIFQLALSKDSRSREFKADRTAAKLISPEAIVRSLVKISAYGNYRDSTEKALFDQNVALSGSLGLASKVAAGLHPYARSVDFVDDLRMAHFPHPFDSHPSLPERMKNVHCVVDEDRFGAIVLDTPKHTWAEQITTATAIEQRLWSAYEEQFAQDHERALAYRYEPANDAERTVVLKYFPPIEFALGKGETVEVNFSGIARSGETLLPWHAVKDMAYKDSSFGDSLQVTLHEKAIVGSKSISIKLSGIGKQKDAFQAATAHYWRRDQIMRSGDV